VTVTQVKLLTKLATEIKLAITENWVAVERRTTDDLPSGLKGTVYWEDEVGYRLETQERFYDVEFINENWYLLDVTKEGTRTKLSGRLHHGKYGTGYRQKENTKPSPYHIPPTDAPRPKQKEMSTSTTPVPQVAPTPETNTTMQSDSQNVTLTAAEYLHYLNLLRQREQEKQPEPLKRTNTPDQTNDEQGTKGGLRGNPPQTFDGDRKKSRSFISDLQIYFQINRKHSDIRNCYTRVLIALSFIKGDNVVNWVDAQMVNLEDDLKLNYGDESQEDIWENFTARFNGNYISTTLKEEALVRIGNLKMEGSKLDEYVTEHATLIALLGWHPSSDIAAEHFRKGLSDPLARKIIENHTLPSTTKAWVEHARTYHSRYTVARAYGYVGK
jgi:hypothetical protein